MAAVSLRSCRRGLSLMLRNAGVAAVPSQHLQGLYNCSLPRVKGKSPGVVFLPGYGSNMNGRKAEALAEFCRSLGHSYLRIFVFLYYFSVISPYLNLQTRKELETKGEWSLPTKHTEEGVYKFSMDFLREAENHCVLQSPIPITCPVRLIHGLKDEDVPWHISMQVAERVLSPDVDIILRRNGQHRMSEKDDIKLMVYTIDDLIDKLTTMV
ncbi:hypothetical protein GOODEAATRI_013886 [Goodea atripinnis]|uniref:Mycophenolic acid acyl-glucuronide esterase, mitochondrial n=1 Tax=Goodea atripinnis TaxID=208336 RepID=A0ABV0N159_9TELE